MARSGVDAYRHFLEELLAWLKQQPAAEVQRWQKLVDSGRIVYKPWVLGFVVPARIYVEFHTRAYYMADGDRREKVLSLETSKCDMACIGVGIDEWRRTFTDLEGSVGEVGEMFFLARSWGYGQTAQDYQPLAEPEFKKELFEWVREAMLRYLKLFPC